MTCKLSIVIVTYNSGKLIGACLASLTNTLKGVSYEVIVVDNDSQDDTLSVVRKCKNRRVRLLEAGENLGFGRANNKGAGEASGEYLLLLNPDTVVKKNTASLLMSYLDKHARCGAVGPLFVYPDGSLQGSFGSMPTYGNEFVQLTFLYKLTSWGRVVIPRPANRKMFLRERVVDWTSGGCLLLRRDLFKKLKGFDDRFFMYMEEIDLCRRMRDLDYTVAFYPKARITHVHRASFGGRITRAQLLEARSILYFLEKWYPHAHMRQALFRFFMKLKLLLKMGVARGWMERGVNSASNGNFNLWRSL